MKASDKKFAPFSTALASFKGLILLACSPSNFIRKLTSVRCISCATLIQLCLNRGCCFA